MKPTKRLCIFGYGNKGKLLFDALERDLVNEYSLCFCDNDDRKFAETPIIVVSPAVAAEQISNGDLDAIVITTAYDANFILSMVGQLDALGVNSGFIHMANEDDDGLSMKSLAEITTLRELFCKPDIDTIPFSYRELSDRQLVLVGKEKFCADIKDYFDGLTFVLQDKLSIRNSDSHLFILCDFDKAGFLRDIDELGLRYETDYIWLDDVINLLSESETLNIAMNYPKRDVVLVGGKSLVRLFRESNRGLAIFRSIEHDDWNADFQYIHDGENKPVFIIITSNLLSSKKQMRNSGYVFGEDFYFFDANNIGLPELLETTIKCDATHDFACGIHSLIAVLDDVGGFRSCCGRINIPLGNVLHNSIKKITMSPLARILNLSTINRTYCFCADHCKYVMSGSGDRGDDGAKRKTCVLPRISDYTVSPAYISACNLWCRSCRDVRRTDKDDCTEWKLSIHEELIASLDDIKNIAHGGGEVFFGKLSRDLFFDKNPRESISFFTNGMLFNPSNWKLLRKKYRHVEITFSIDGGTKQTFEYLRRGAKFERFLSNLRMAGELRKVGEISRLTLTTAVQERNFRELEKIIEIGREVHADAIVFAPIQKWKPYSDEDFLYINVYSADNPHHREFVSIIDKPIFGEPDIVVAGKENLLRLGELDI